jgi:PleD family two-component response regulator
MFVFPHTELADAMSRLQAFAVQLSEDQKTLGYQQLTVTFSAGLVQVNKQKTLYEMIGDADKLLYDAKAAGRNRILS